MNLEKNALQFLCLLISEIWLKHSLAMQMAPCCYLFFFPFPVWLDVSKLRTIDSMRIHMKKKLWSWPSEIPAFANKLAQIFFLSYNYKFITYLSSSLRYIVSRCYVMLEGRGGKSNTGIQWVSGWLLLVQHASSKADCSA